MRLGTASTISGPRRTEACPGAACLRRLGQGGRAWDGGNHGIFHGKTWGKPLNCGILLGILKTGLNGIFFFGFL